MATFRTIHTNYGLSKMAAAEASGIPINLTHMAVGDGNGNPSLPSQGQTSLVGEKFRATINRVYQDPDNELKFTAELVVPASEGGFTMREVGVFDADGALFAVGNLPATYKPSAIEGAYSDTAIRMEFVVSNADVVTIQIDPNITIATQSWITNNITAAALIPGGLTSQILSKASNANGDFVWTDLTSVNVTVDMIEERQVLAAAQTTVTMATCTTRGLAVYIEGVRLRKEAGLDGWQIAGGGTSLNQITLGKSYPVGARITLVQNSPTGSAPAPLERSQNLADVQSVATARTNLDVFSKAEANQLTPVGAVMYFAFSSAPNGWLKLNGASVSRTAYASLFSKIGTTFGAGDGFTTFNLPDARGEFIRGFDDGRGVDAGRVIGSSQGDLLKAHDHFIPSIDVTDIRAFAVNDNGGDSIVSADNSGLAGYGIARNTRYTTSATVGGETRPRNLAMLACIKF